MRHLWNKAARGARCALTTRSRADARLRLAPLNANVRCHVDATAKSHCARYAVLTFVTLLAVPVLVFLVAGVASANAGAGSANWPQFILVYAAGTVPGVVLGARYLHSRKSKAAFVTGYVLACAGLLVVESLAIGCWLTNVCL